MKKTLITVIGMTALCLHSTTLEEARRIIREGVEGIGPLDTPEKRERSDQIFTAIALLGFNEGNLALSVYCELIAEHFDNPAMESPIMRGFSLIGKNPAVSVNQDALDWVRKVVRKDNPRNSNIWAAERFLSYKGDARDLELVSSSYERKRLTARVAGTNIVEWFDPIGTQNNYFDFIPSVTNTGPQALYAREILYRAWEMLPEVVMMDDYRLYIYRDARKIPAELLTMVVWFDDDGNPVCNVDLEKYGLTMPVLDVPNKPKGKEKPSPPLEGERPREPETNDGIPAVESSDRLQPPEQTEPPTAGSRRLVWFYLGIAVLILGVVTAWRCFKKPHSLRHNRKEV